MNKKMAAKLSSLPCFEAFWVIFCPVFVHIFPSCVWGGGGGVGGHLRVSELCETDLGV